MAELRTSKPDSARRLLQQLCITRIKRIRPVMSLESNFGLGLKCIRLIATITFSNRFTRNQRCQCGLGDHAGLLHDAGKMCILLPSGNVIGWIEMRLKRKAVGYQHSAVSEEL